MWIGNVKRWFYRSSNCEMFSRALRTFERDKLYVKLIFVTVNSIFLFCLTAVFRIYVSVYLKREKTPNKTLVHGLPRKTGFKALWSLVHGHKRWRTFFPEAIFDCSLDRLSILGSALIYHEQNTAVTNAVRGQQKTALILWSKQLPWKQSLRGSNPVNCNIDFVSTS